MQGNLLIKKDLRNIKKITIYRPYFYPNKLKKILYKVNVKNYQIFALVETFKFLGIIVWVYVLQNIPCLLEMHTDIFRDETS